MEAALSLFLKKGFDNVSLREIKKEANITSGGFYHYFKTKDDLLIEVEKKYILNHFETAMKHIGDIDGTFNQKMKLILEYIISYDQVLEKDMNNFPNTDIYKDYYLLYLETVRRNKEARSAIEKFNKNLYELNLKIVDESKKNGEITSKTNNKDLSIFIMSIIKGSIELWMSIPTIDLRNTFNENINLFLTKIAN